MMNTNCNKPSILRKLPFFLPAVCLGIVLGFPGHSTAQTPLSVVVGPDQEIPLNPGTTMISGTPNIPVSAILWTVTGGDASKVTIDSPNALDSNVSFSATGVYTLRLQVQVDPQVATDSLTITVFNFRPDIRIGRKRLPESHLGDGVYNDKGDGQRIPLKSRQNRPVTFYFSVENDGTAEDRLKIRGSRVSRSRFDVRYLDITRAKPRNITATVQVHKYAETYAVGEVRRFCGTISRRLKTAKRKKIAANPRFKVTSLNAPGNLPDVAEAKLYFLSK
jgi:hypothetical protein